MRQLCSLAMLEHISCPLRIERAGLMSPPISMHYLFRRSAPQRRPAFCLCVFSPPLSISVILPFCSREQLFRSVSPSDVAPSRRHKYSSIAALSFQDIIRWWLKKTRRYTTDLQTNHGTCSQQIDQTDCRLSQTGDSAGHRILWNNRM